MCMAAQWSRPITHSHWRVVNISWVQCCCCTQSAVFCSSSSLYTFSSCTVTGCLYFSFFFFQLFCFCGARLSFLSSREVKLCFWCRTVWLAQEGIPTERVSFFFFFLPISLKKNSSNHVGQVFHSPKSFFFFLFTHIMSIYDWEKTPVGYLLVLEAIAVIICTRVLSCCWSFANFGKKKCHAHFLFVHPSNFFKKSNFTSFELAFHNFSFFNVIGRPAKFVLRDQPICVMSVVFIYFDC